MSNDTIEQLKQRAESAEALCADLRDALSDALTCEVRSGLRTESIKALLARIPADVGKELKWLREWKQSALEAEAAWDVQEVGRLIEARLGTDIRSQIAPAINAFRARVAEQEAAWDEQLKNVERLQARVAELEGFKNSIHIYQARNERLVAALWQIRALPESVFGDHWCNDKALRTDDVHEICDAALADNGAHPDAALAKVADVFAVRGGPAAPHTFAERALNNGAPAADDAEPELRRMGVPPVPDALRDKVDARAREMQIPTHATPAAHPDTARLAAVFNHCRVVYFPPCLHGSAPPYPIEHAPKAGKDQRETILRLLDAAMSAQAKEDTR